MRIESILTGLGVRAVDDSNVVPLRYVDRVLALAKENGIPAQYGVNGGANDGAVFLRYGSVEEALGWPLRYSHSPAEVIDTKDLDALGNVSGAVEETSSMIAFATVPRQSRRTGHTCSGQSQFISSHGPFAVPSG